MQVPVCLQVPMPCPPGQVRLIFAKSCGIYVRTARFGVGVDAHIDPLGNCEFAGDYRKNRCILPGRQWASAPTGYG